MALRRLSEALAWFAAGAAGFLVGTAGSVASERVMVGALAIDRTEVDIGRFARFAAATGLRTAAEREGGGHEWGDGWERRAGWTFRTPFGLAPENSGEPAVHLSWFEADAYCRWAGGRLPSRAEWSEAAYVERRPAPPDGLAPGRRYEYPTGTSPAGANTGAPDPWPRHAPAGTTRAGVNGLHDMGGNVWEWLADRDGAAALTAGGSWWYGADKMRADAMQWKPAGFYVAYIGFRCVYPAGAGGGAPPGNPAIPR